MENSIEKVYDYCILNVDKKLTAEQDIKFRCACEKAVLENPDLGFSDWVIAAKVYLRFIIDFRDLDLGPVIQPDR